MKLKTHLSIETGQMIRKVNALGRFNYQYPKAWNQGQEWVCGTLHILLCVSFWSPSTIWCVHSLNPSPERFSNRLDKTKVTSTEKEMQCFKKHIAATIQDINRCIRRKESKTEQFLGKRTIFLFQLLFPPFTFHIFHWNSFNFFSKWYFFLSEVL